MSARSVSIGVNPTAHRARSGLKDPSGALVVVDTVGAMTPVVPVALAGDELRVPCVDGGQRRYLSFDAAAATGALPSVLDAVQAFVPWYAA